MKELIGIFIIGLILLPTSATMGSPSATLTDGGFEQWDTSNLVNWVYNGTYPLGQGNSTEARTGNYCAEFNCSGNEELRQNLGYVEEGQTLNISVYGRIRNAWSYEYSVRVEWYIGNTYLSSTSVGYGSADTWGEITNDLTVPAGGIDNATLFLSAHLDRRNPLHPTLNETIFFDDVTIVGSAIPEFKQSSIFFVLTSFFVMTVVKYRKTIKKAD